MQYRWGYITEVSWRPSWICKLAHFQTQTGQQPKMVQKKKLKIGWIIRTGKRLLISCICKLVHGGHLGYEITWFSNLSRIIHQRVLRNKIEKIGWILMTGELSRWSWICKLAHDIHLGYANWLIFELKQDNPAGGVQKKICKDRMNIDEWRANCSRRSWICKLARGGHLWYANKLIFELEQDSPSEGVEKKNCEDQMNIDDWRAFTSLLNMQISPWQPSWICKLADFQS